jgi:hypothetical protein
MGKNAPNNNFIAEYRGKAAGGLAALYSSPVSVKVLELCNKGRREPAAELNEKVIIEALGFNYSEFSNIRGGLVKGRPSPGRVLDLAALLGFAPPLDKLRAMEERFENANAVSPYPRNVYAMMEYWEDESPEACCWAAFVGSPNQLRRFALAIPAPERGRGAASADFLHVYNRHLPHLTPQLFDTVHWTKSPEPRATFRIDRNMPSYMRKSAPSAPTELPVNAAIEHLKKIALSPVKAVALPAWMDPARGVPLWESMLPGYGRSEFEMQEKSTLYGGRSARLSAGFSPVKFAVARHSFDREDISVLRSEIQAATKPCCSFTLKSRKGAGLSMALAQLVRDLAVDEHTRVLWILDEPNRTRELLAALSDTTAQELAEWAVAQGNELERLVLVIDDVSLAKPREIARLLRFRDRCKILFPTLGGPKLALVFGSFGAARTCSEDAEIELKLTHADQEACYAKMAREAPTIIADRSGGLSGLIRAHPEARWHADDAQALIDFFMEHGAPSSVAVAHWLARTDDLDEPKLEMLTMVAVAQLVGLHVPERVAVNLFSVHRTVPFEGAEDIVQTVSRLNVEDRDWRGVGLSCPRPHQPVQCGVPSGRLRPLGFSRFR